MEEKNNNVVSLCDWRDRVDAETDELIESWEAFEADIHMKMHQSMDAHLAMSKIYNVHPALVAEYCMGGVLAILGEAIRDYDSPAAKDVLNWLNEITDDMLDIYEIRMGRDQDERHEWRESTFRHRWEEPPANDE